MKKESQPYESEFEVFQKENSSQNQINTHRLFGEYLFQLEHYREAAWYADRVIELKEGHNEVVSIQDYEQASASYYASGNYNGALKNNSYLLNLEPNNSSYLRFAGLYNMLLGNLEEAEDYYHKAMQVDPKEANTHDALSHLYELKGEREKGLRFGNMALVLKDEEAIAPANIKRIINIIGRSLSIDSKVPPFTSDNPSKNVIAFSLWGSDPQYTEGAILNATLAPAIYPGWQCRFYCDTTVPESVVNQLRALASDVRLLDRNELAFFGLFWRFFVADDPLVDRYIIRDCDCILNCQERVAVDEWIDSGKHFHVMRDYPSHTELIHAGLWGGVRGAIPKMIELIVDFYDNNSKERTIDQRFLRYSLWPIIKKSYLCHDSCFEFDNSKKFPQLGQYPQGTGNVGINWQSIYGK